MVCIHLATLITVFAGFSGAMRLNSKRISRAKNFSNLSAACDPGDVDCSGDGTSCCAARQICCDDADAGCCYIGTACCYLGGEPRCCS
ncbi:hypothetical protein PILCRDRAFT_829491 [Piloderma croceum F 1598]|uniref:Granulins domain-containing protein n=1 Tax=Piloderma croceum (strain F 1598) TaxID=765440 RepID=A0A0C3EYY9_PILCF|nr:hypothetical protein PILCRDRAFT_829491 [Piloderma croceum F 1598]